MKSTEALTVDGAVFRPVYGSDRYRLAQETDVTIPLAAIDSIGDHHFVIEHVFRQRNDHRPGAAAGGDVDRAGDNLGNA